MFEIGPIPEDHIFEPEGNANHKNYAKFFQQSGREILFFELFDQNQSSSFKIFQVSASTCIADQSQVKHHKNS